MQILLLECSYKTHHLLDLGRVVVVFPGRKERLEGVRRVDVLHGRLCHLFRCPVVAWLLSLLHPVQHGLDLGRVVVVGARCQEGPDVG